MYIRVRKIGEMYALLMFGEDEEGKSELIDYRICERENEINYEEFLDNLRQRNLKMPMFFVTDGHKRLHSAIQTVYPFAKIQVCVVHKKRDVISKTSVINRENVSKDLGYIYRSSTREEAFIRLKEFKNKWRNKEPFKVYSFQYDFNLTLTYLEFDKSIHKKIMTNNSIERYISEIRRRTKPNRIFSKHREFG